MFNPESGYPPEEILNKEMQKTKFVETESDEKKELKKEEVNEAIIELWEKTGEELTRVENLFRELSGKDWGRKIESEEGKKEFNETKEKWLKKRDEVYVLSAALQEVDAKGPKTIEEFERAKVDALKEIIRGICENGKKFKNLEALQVLGEEVLEKAIFELGEEFGREEAEAEQISEALKESRPRLVKILDKAKTTFGRLLGRNLRKESSPTTRLMEISEQLGIFRGRSDRSGRLIERIRAAKEKLEEAERVRFS